MSSDESQESQPQEKQEKRAPVPVQEQTEPQGERIVRPSITLLEWEAPERIFKKYPREFYRKIAVMLLFFALMLIIMKEFLLIIVLGIVFFVIYVFHTVPPRKVRHLVTTNGLNYASEHLYRWDDLQSFYLEKKDDVDLLIVNTVDPLPGRLFLLIDKKVDLNNLSEIMNERVSIVEDPQPGVIDKFTSKISSRIRV